MNLLVDSSARGCRVMVAKFCLFIGALGGRGGGGGGDMAYLLSGIILQNQNNPRPCSGLTVNKMLTKAQRI